MITYIKSQNYTYVSCCHLASNCFSMGVYASQLKGHDYNDVYWNLFFLSLKCDIDIMTLTSE